MIQLIWEIPPKEKFIAEASRAVTIFPTQIVVRTPQYVLHGFAARAPYGLGREPAPVEFGEATRVSSCWRHSFKGSSVE
jgi:hypothetical protein